jgi:hypothetical protein
MPLSPAQTDALRAFAGTMIPASTTYGVPGADDSLIFADIVKSLGRDKADIVRALARLDELAGDSFTRLDPARRLEIATEFRAEGGPAVAALSRSVLVCYYRDDRVMLSLGQEPRAPFPKGHTVEQGDWSLLEPVKRRAPFYRKVR